MNTHPGSRMRSQRAAIMLLGLLVAIGMGFAGVGSAQPAAAVDNGSLGIRPSNESAFFHLSVVPRDSVKAAAIVSNHQAVPVTLQTYVVDGLTSPSGAFALNEASAPRVGVGLWSQLATSQITVPPNSDLTVLFTLSVPAGTPPGDYAGGLIIQSLPVAGEVSNTGSTSVRVDIVQRQGVRIYLTVPGKTVAGLAVHTLNWALSDHHVVLSLMVTNTGNVTLHPTASIGVDRWFGGETKLPLVKPESVPPGATVTLTGTYPADAWAQLATAHAVVISDAGTKSSATGIFWLSFPLVIAFIVVAILAFLGTWRIVRFVRKSRRALVLLAQVSESGPGESSTEL